MQQADPNINIINAKRGWEWLMQSGDIIGRYRGAFFIIALVWSAFVYLQAIPVIGSILFIVLTPALQAGAMYAVAKAGNKEEPGLGDLFAILNSDRRSAMLQLALILLICAFIAVMIIGFMLTAVVPELAQLQNIQDIQLENINFAGIWLLLSVAVVFIAIVSLAVFFAIPRVAFDHQSPLVAMGESFRAGLKNWRALLLFSLAQFVVMVAAILMLSILLAVFTLITGGTGLIIQSILINLVLTFIQLLISGGQYLAWQDVFGHPDSRGGNSGGDQSIDEQSPSGSDDELIA